MCCFSITNGFLIKLVSTRKSVCEDLPSKAEGLGRSGIAAAVSDKTRCSEGTAHFLGAVGNGSCPLETCFANTFGNLKFDCFTNINKYETKGCLICRSRASDPPEGIWV